MHTLPTEEPRPAWARRLLARWSRPELYEELGGDLEEEYHRRLQQRGRRRAALCYAWDVLFLLRAPLLRRGRPYANAKGPIMWKNYVNVGKRNLGRQKGHALVNAGGLALGLAFCLLVAAFVRHEWSYDRFHEHADAVHRVLVRQKAPDGTVRRVSLTPLPLAPALRESFPQVEQAVRLADGEGIVQHGEALFTEPLLFTDAGLFDVFTFPLVQGEARTALADPESGAVLSIVPRERAVIRAGVVDRGRTVRDANLMALGMDCAKAIRAVGAINIQCRVVAGVPTVFEINPRFSGGIPLTIAAGADFPRLLVQLARGRRVTPLIGRFQDGLWMSSYETSVFVAEQAVGFSSTRPDTVSEVA
jgi:hypothetical protein